ncbi:hypothetical protein ACFQL1_05350 [Halomicroarcula sp. GCM10025709]|uniref:hypothetical protein n=1 Tax=Haloarcula TaxID=2237 RepID=UPI0024C47023|nr:hypothetical protein [Halomicroarcula sp. YJ-61-S]
MAAAIETEPRVLARAKRRLFPDDRADQYVVTDTQFAQEQWLSETPIPAETRAALAPFNHVRVGSGYPDLVGVGRLDNEVLAVDRLGEEPPLVAVEAKGLTRHGGADVARGVVQAHDRLGEANVAFVAAPARTIDQSTRTLARQVNVGLLGVDADSVSVLERPRVVGARSPDDATAIRFQASPQGVTDRSFGLNHPKNYLAVPLAVVHDGPTDDILADRVVGAVDDARRGAVFLGLLDRGPTDRLTPLGREVVRFAHREYDTVDEALDAFGAWKRSRKRFADIAPRWGQLARRVVYAYPATQLLVEELQCLHDDGFPAPSLVAFVEYLHATHPTFTVELFVRGDADVRRRVLTDDGGLRRPALTDGGVYHSPTVFQLKAMLYHAGVVTERGSEPSRLDPETDTWALRESVPER